MRILFVAMSESVHTARWINQLKGEGWDIHLFPSIDTGKSHENLQQATVHHTLFGPYPHAASLRRRGVPVWSTNISALFRLAIRRYFPTFEARRLARVIRKYKPDIIHSLEMQSGAYLTLQAKSYVRGPFPKWIVTNWGSDIYLFGKLREHEKKIRAVLAACNYYSCECARDIDLAKAYGFAGMTLPTVPNSGGMHTANLTALQSKTMPSQRKQIMLKGYQHWAGRALVGLRALERCADILQGYEIVIYSITQGPWEVHSDVRIAAELFQQRTGIPVRILPTNTKHGELLQEHGKARISIGLSISDAISTSLLEAMAMGSFPIQSNTACADEWITHGKTGLLVPPEDPDKVEEAIRHALTNDALVDSAAKINQETIKKRASEEVVRPQVLAMYRSVEQSPAV